MKRSDIERILGEGLITPAQYDAIIGKFHLEENKSHKWLAVSLSSLAGLLVLGGIIMLVSANWEFIPPMVKMGTGIALMVLFWVLHICFAEKRPVTAEAFSLLGGGMWLANIALYAQIFNLQNPFAEGCALFLAGIILLPLLTRQRVLVAAVALTTVVLFLAAVDGDSSLITLEPYVQPDEEFFVMAGVSALIVFWWVVSERCRDCKGYLRSHAWLAIPAGLALVFFWQAILQYEKVWHEPAAYTLEQWTPTLCVLALVPVVLLLFKPKGPWGIWLFFTLCTTVMAGAYAALRLPETAELPGRLIAIGLCFAYGIVFMFTGTRFLRLSWINYGSLFIICAGIALMVDVFDSFTESGIALIACGVLLFVLLCLVESSRRKVAAKVREEKIAAAKGQAPKPVPAPAPAPKPVPAPKPIAKPVAVVKPAPKPVPAPAPVPKPAPVQGTIPCAMNPMGVSKPVPAPATPPATPPAPTPPPPAAPAAPAPAEAPAAEKPAEPATSTPSEQ